MLLQLTNVRKEYRLGDQMVAALDGVNFTLSSGEFVAIMGPSGSGKSTLLHIMSFLDPPSSGSIFFEGREIKNFSEKELARLRNQAIGFVFQQFNLLPRLSAWENVALPLMYANVERQEQFTRAKTLLELVGLGERINNTRAQLSGGQQQRVAIARALVNKPRILFADEPTGNLDSKSGAEIMDILTKLNSQGNTIVMVTHERDIAAYSNRQVMLRDGQIVSDRKKRRTKG